MCVIALTSLYWLKIAYRPIIAYNLSWNQEVIFMISYDVFWATLKEKEVSQYTLIEKYGISSSVLTRIRRSDYLGLRKIEDLCRILQCDICNIVRYIPD